MSPPEVVLWQALRDKRLRGLKFRRHHPVQPYTLDFFCPAASLAVEIDGAGHDDPKRMSRDAQRDEFLLAQGIRTVRIPARAVLDELDGVLGWIAREAGAPD